MSTLPQESWSFSFLNYAVQHQGIKVLDVVVSYDYRAGLGASNPFEYPNFLPVADFVDAFFINYPNETDFWEILNRKLVESLLTDPVPTTFGFDYRLADAVDNMTVSITIYPDTDRIPFFRTSFVTQEVFVGTEEGDAFTGTFYGDAMRAAGGADTLLGEDGDDWLDAGAGNDQLFGGEGADSLAGGADGDRMTGGAGADDFVFRSLADATGDRHDRILDFSQEEGDRIDLGGIDAIPGGSNDAFTLVASFSGTAGELVARARADGFRVQGDLDGDGAADFTIVVLTTAPSLTAADFVL